MFRNTKIFAGFSVDDLQKAKEFYGKTLGLDVTESNGFLEIHIAGGGTVFIYPKDDHVPATFTVLNFPVDDIEQAVDKLTKLGARFEIYKEGPTRTDEKGISTGGGMKAAWFKDPAGNFLALLQEE